MFAASDKVPLPLSALLPICNLSSAFDSRSCALFPHCPTILCRIYLYNATSLFAFRFRPFNAWSAGPSHLCFTASSYFFLAFVSFSFAIFRWCMAYSPSPLFRSLSHFVGRCLREPPSFGAEAAVAVACHSLDFHWLGDGADAAVACHASCEADAAV